MKLNTAAAEGSRLESSQVDKEIKAAARPGHLTGGNKACADGAELLGIPVELIAPSAYGLLLLPAAQTPPSLRCVFV